MPSRLSPVTAREVVHLLVLRELTEVRRGVVVVKGGVNMRLFFGSVRYSEDIDLDGDPEAAPAIRAAIEAIFVDRAFTRALQAVGVRGLDPGHGPNKDSQTTFRYKFHVVLPGDVRYPTKIEVSFHDRHALDASVVEKPDARLFAPYGIEPFSIRRYVREAAVRQKVCALGGRREAQARDVFDLHILVAGKITDGLIAFLVETLQQDTLKEAYARALTISFKEYEGQVVEFLDDEAVAEYARERAWDDIRLEVAALLEAVLAAQEEG